MAKYYPIGAGPGNTCSGKGPVLPVYTRPMTEIRPSSEAAGRLPPGIGPHRTDLAAEFREKPFGNHSPDLQALLDHMRGGPIHGKYFLWLMDDHSKWKLARFSETPPLTPEAVPDGPVFDNIEDAERYVFVKRWTDLFGAEPEGS